MKKEDKILLIRDLCEKLQYGLYVNYKGEKYLLDSINRFDEAQLEGCNYTVPAYKLKPYLRNMLCMSNKEKLDNSYRRVMHQHRMRIKHLENPDALRTFTFDNPNGIPGYTCTVHEFYGDFEYLGWLSEHFIDHRGLIDKGIALVAPVGMYKY